MAISLISLRAGSLVAKVNKSIHPNSRRMSDRLLRMELAEKRWNDAKPSERAGMFKPNSRPGKRPKAES